MIMNKAELIYQSEALTEGWEKIGSDRPWWFDTSVAYQKRYSLDGRGTPIVWDDEDIDFSVEDTRQCTGGDTCTIILAQNKKRALVMVNRELDAVMVLGGVEKEITWEDYTQKGLWAVKQHIPGYVLEAVIINPKIKTLEKFKVVKSIIKKVIEAAQQAQAHEFISNLPEGYASEIGERGVQLSGGERQRVAIARAFLSDPRILILDDSTSAIDSNTEDKIQFAIKNILKNRTTFLITHRLSQIRWADLIIVLKDGKIEAKGNHQELLKISEEYRKIFVKKFDLDEEKLVKGVI